MRFKKEDRTVTMVFRIDELEPARRVAWTCTDNGNPIWRGTRLVFEIEPVGAGSRLRFRHTGFQDTESPLYEMTVGGRQHFMSSLRSYLEGGTGTPG